MKAVEIWDLSNPFWSLSNEDSTRLMYIGNWDFGLILLCTNNSNNCQTPKSKIAKAVFTDSDPSGAKSPPKPNCCSPQRRGTLAPTLALMPHLVKCNSFLCSLAPLMPYRGKRLCAFYGFGLKSRQRSIHWPLLLPRCYAAKKKSKKTFS